jgi:hypothetical protein
MEKFHLRWSSFWGAGQIEFAIIHKGRAHLSRSDQKIIRTRFGLRFYRRKLVSFDNDKRTTGRNASTSSVEERAVTPLTRRKKLSTVANFRAITVAEGI